jgi:ABC-type glycerol-3-phosphate transport system substrate-binding protein
MLSYRYFPTKRPKRNIPYIQHHPAALQEGTSMHRGLHSSLSRRPRYQKAAGVTLTAALGLGALAACSSSSSSTTGTTTTNQAVTITVACAPPTTNTAQVKNWNNDVSNFEKLYPYITIHSIYAAQCIDAQTQTAQLAAGTEPNVYGVYFGSLDTTLVAGQAADITSYINAGDVPAWNDIVPSAKAAVTAGTSIYGIPYFNYTQGLIYNRALFTQAGLNPNDPPTTWAQVEADATAITKLGHGIYGYGDYSADNNGGWHFSSEIDANGGAVTNAAGTAASIDTTAGMQVLQALHTLRFTDKAMSATQALGWGTLQAQFAEGKLGMYIAAPDDIYNVIVPTDHGNINDIGMGPLPSESGTPAGTLSGGNYFAFAKRDTPAQIEAGIKWINFEDLTLGRGFNNYAQQKADGQPVGFDEPQLFQGTMGAQYKALLAKYSTINQSYYSAYVNTPETPDGQPVDDQALYKTMDPMMLSVLTEANVNLSSLLTSTQNNLNSVLSDANGG